MDEWEKLERGDASSSGSGDDPLEHTAGRYAMLEAQAELIRAEMDELKKTIAGQFPEEAGKLFAETPSYKIFCERPEKWSWDKDQLEHIFGEGELPSYVRRSLSVDKRKFEALPASEKAPLLPALTRKPGSPKIEVQKK